jgi:hypothetical protein
MKKKDFKLLAMFLFFFKFSIAQTIEGIDDLEKNFNEAQFYSVICKAQEMLLSPNLQLGERIAVTEVLAMAASAYRDYELAEKSLSALLKMTPGYIFPARMRSDPFLHHLFVRVEAEYHRAHKKKVVHACDSSVYYSGSCDRRCCLYAAA